MGLSPAQRDARSSVQSAVAFPARPRQRWRQVLIKPPEDLPPFPLVSDLAGTATSPKAGRAEKSPQVCPHGDALWARRRAARRGRERAQADAQGRRAELEAAGYVTGKGTRYGAAAIARMTAG